VSCAGAHSWARRLSTSAETSEVAFVPTEDLDG
jgi:hypothetical protein